MRGEVGKETPKKKMENPSFSLRHKNKKLYRLGFVASDKKNLTTLNNRITSK